MHLSAAVVNLSEALVHFTSFTTTFTVNKVVQATHQLHDDLHREQGGEYKVGIPKGEAV